LDYSIAACSMLGALSFFGGRISNSIGSPTVSNTASANNRRDSDHRCLARDFAIQEPAPLSSCRKRPAPDRTERIGDIDLFGQRRVAICVLRTSSVCTSEMPMLLPMLRIRLYMAVPCARMCGASVAKVAVLSGTNTRPSPNLDHARPDDILLRNRQRIGGHLPQRKCGDRKTDGQQQPQVDLADQAPDHHHREHGSEAARAVTRPVVLAE